MTEQGSRMYELDLLRLLAAGSVVAFHFTYGNHSLGFNPTTYPQALTAVTRYGFLGVQVFFFISGIVILNSASSGSGRRFAISRMVRLYPAYWACVTATFLLVNLAGSRHIPLSDYGVNMSMLEGFLAHPLVDAVYWTLQVELIFYGIVWLTLVTGQMKRITTVLWAWLGVAALTTAAQVAGSAVPNRIIVATGYAAYFVVGAAATLIVRGRRDGPVIALLAASCGLSLARAFYDARAAREMYHGVSVAVAVVIVAGSMILVLAIAFGRLSRFGRPWMVAAGLLTYPLYLLHDEVSNVLYTHWQGLNRWLLLALVLTIVVAASWAVHAVVEKPVATRLRAALEQAWATFSGRRGRPRSIDPVPVAGPVAGPPVPVASQAPPG